MNYAQITMVVKNKQFIFTFSHVTCDPPFLLLFHRNSSFHSVFHFFFPRFPVTISFHLCFGLPHASPINFLLSFYVILPLRSVSQTILTYFLTFFCLTELLWQILWYSLFILSLLLIPVIHLKFVISDGRLNYWLKKRTNLVKFYCKKPTLKPL